MRRIEQFQFFGSVGIRLFIDNRFHRGIFKTMYRHGSLIGAAWDLFKKMHFFLKPVINTLEFPAAPKRPVDRIGMNPEDILQFIDQLKR